MMGKPLMEYKFKCTCGAACRVFTDGVTIQHEIKPPKKRDLIDQLAGSNEDDDDNDGGEDK